MRAGRAKILLCICALGSLAATLSVESLPLDTLFLCSQFPPALETSPAGGSVLVARAESGPCGQSGPGVVEVRALAGQALAQLGAPYLLPGNLNCSESTPFFTPRVGGFTLEPAPSTRVWLTTSSCELAVPFDAVSHAGIAILYAGQARMAVPTRHTLTGSFTRYQASGPGAAVSSFKTNFTSAALRVGDRLLVATSNFQQAGANPVLHPGSVLFFEIDDGATPPRIEPAVPFYALTSDPNPVALTALPGGRVLVTNAGLFDAAFPPLVTGRGSIDVLDPATGRWVASIPLGMGNPGGRSLAIDPSGSVALAGSQTLRQLFAIDLRGIDALPAAPIDAALQRPSCNDTSAASAGGLPCLRERAIHSGANPIALPAPPGTSGSYSLISEVRFAASGTFAAATSFNDGGLALLAFDPRNLDRPHPLLPSRFGSAEVLAATGAAGTIGEECCPGPFILEAGPGGALEGARVLFATASPNGVLVRGTLSGTLPDATGDYDGDGSEDALDVCPAAPDASQLDSGGIASALADGIGDACQCGDVSSDGRVSAVDRSALRAFLAGSPSSLSAPEKCDVGSSAACDLADTARIARALAGLPGGIENRCEPFRL